MQIAIINYESVWRLEKEIKLWNPSLIIADEGHKIKGHHTAVSKSMHKLGSLSRYNLLLTGTAITNKEIDIFSEYKFLNPSIFGNSFYAFRNHYFRMSGYGNYIPVFKRELEYEFKQKIASIAYRVTKEECLDLPDTVGITRYIELEDSAKKAYESLAKKSYAELKNSEITATNILTKLLRLSQLTGGFLTDDETHKTECVSNAKLTVLQEMIYQTIEENTKLVIIARFKAEIKMICKLIESKKAKYSLITGDTKNRQEQVNVFQNEKDCHFFIGQIKTTALGITLTSANKMVFYSLDYSMSNFNQAKARIHRVGQNNKCTYYYLLAKGTIDEKVYRTLKYKVNLADRMLSIAKEGQNPFIEKGKE